MSGPSDKFGEAKREAEPESLPQGGNGEMTEREKMMAGLPCMPVSPALTSFDLQSLLKDALF